MEAVSIYSQTFLLFVWIWRHDLSCILNGLLISCFQLNLTNEISIQVTCFFLFISAICILPCLNNGKCSHPYMCTCPPGYEGIRCQKGMLDHSNVHIGCNSVLTTSPIPHGMLTHTLTGLAPTRASNAIYENNIGLPSPESSIAKFIIFQTLDINTTYYWQMCITNGNITIIHSSKWLLPRDSTERSFVQEHQYLRINHLLRIAMICRL